MHNLDRGIFFHLGWPKNYLERKKKQPKIKLTRIQTKLETAQFEDIISLFTRRQRSIMTDYFPVIVLRKPLPQVTTTLEKTLGPLPPPQFQEGTLLKNPDGST